MDSSVIRDISDDGTPAASPAPVPTRPQSDGTGRAQRRFAFDPASSPVLVAALAWDTPVAR